MIAQSHPQSRSMEAVMVERNKHLVWSLVKRYTWANMELEDLYSEGVCGLLIAARKFDSSKGFKFSTYAVSWIRQHMGRAAEQSGTVRVPSHCYESISKLRQAYSVLGDGASQEELCSYLSWTRAKLEGILAARQAGHIASLDAPVTNNSIKGDNDTELMDFQASVGGDPFDEVSTKLEVEGIEAILSDLPARQAAIIRERYLSGDELITLAEVGRVVGTSREHTRQIEAVALRNIKNAVRKAGIYA